MENYNGGEQLDLPGVEDSVQENPYTERAEGVEGDSVVGTNHRSEMAELYMRSRTEEDRWADDCPICGGSGPCFRCGRK